MASRTVALLCLALSGLSCASSQQQIDQREADSPGGEAPTTTETDRPTVESCEAAMAAVVEIDVLHRGGSAEEMEAYRKEALKSVEPFVARCRSELTVENVRCVTAATSAQELDRCRGVDEAEGAMRMATREQCVRAADNMFDVQIDLALVDVDPARREQVAKSARSRAEAVMNEWVGRCVGKLTSAQVECVATTREPDEFGDCADR